MHCAAAPVQRMSFFELAVLHQTAKHKKRSAHARRSTRQNVGAARRRFRLETSLYSAAALRFMSHASNRLQQASSLHLAPFLPFLHFPWALQATVHASDWPTGCLLSGSYYPHARVPGFALARVSMLVSHATGERGEREASSWPKTEGQDQAAKG